MTATTECLSSNELVELADGRLSEAERLRAVEHLERCASCCELLAAAAGDGGQSAHGVGPGSVVGRYVIAELVGMGASGAVYRAHDPTLSRFVALKLLRVAASDPAGDRLILEANSLARLSHPNVVAIHDVGTVEDQVFLAMELGRTTLRKWLADAPRDPREVLKLLRQAGEGLAAAHATGLVHRDVKPENVLVATDGRALITDFGLARSQCDPGPLPDDAPIDSATMTKTGALIGTPAYMAPEQLDGAAADERTDQFAYCVTLFEAMTGSRPYVAHTLRQLRDATRRERFDRGAARRLPGWLRRIVLRGLRADPGDRWPSLRHLLGALAAGPPLSRTSVRIGLTAGVAAALLLVSMGWGILASSRQRARAERRFADVHRLASSFLFEFDKAIETLPGASGARKLVVQRAQEYLDDLAAEASDDAGLQRELAEAYERLAGIQAGPNLSLGERAGARVSLDKALAIREALAAATGSDVDLSALAKCLATVGMTGTLGPASLAPIRRSLALREALHARAPADPARQRALATGTWSLAQALRAVGEYGEALVLLERSAALRERLVAAHPDNLNDQRNAALAAKYLGSMLQKSGDVTAATEQYRRAIAIDGLLVAGAPFDALAKLDLSYSEASLASALNDAGAREQALTVFRQALSLRQAVAGADPANQTARWAVASAHRSMGQVLGDMGRPAEQIVEVQKALATYGPTSGATSADDASWLADCYLDLGGAELALAVAAGARRTEVTTHLGAARAWAARSRDLLAPLIGKRSNVAVTETFVRAAAVTATCDDLIAFNH